jgi:hypothetical protein
MNSPEEIIDFVISWKKPLFMSLFDIITTYYFADRQVVKYQNSHDGCFFD